jgi:opacity protein-like surface antigen
MTRVRILAAFCFVVGVAANAAAQGFISPFAVTTVSSPSSLGGHTKPGFGVALGGLGGVIGGETEFTYYPELLDNTSNGLAKNRVFTLTANTLIGPKVGPVRVYAALGGGELYLDVTSVSSIVIPNPQSVSNNYFTFDVGGGVMGNVASHLAIRGDVRYYRAFGFNVSDVQQAGLSLTHFDFWRLGGGVALTF